MSDAQRIAALERRIEKLEHALLMQVALSRSTAPAVDTGVVQTHQGRIDPLSIADAMPTYLNYGFSSSLPVGGDKVVVFLQGKRSQGMVVGTGHQTYRFTGLKEGEVVMHDKWGNSIRLTEAGIVIQCGTHAVKILNAGVVTMDATLLKVKGDIIDNYSSNTLNLAQTRAAHNAHKHTVPGVQAGSATVTSAVPTARED